MRKGKSGSERRFVLLLSLPPAHTRQVMDVDVRWHGTFAPGEELITQCNVSQTPTLETDDECKNIENNTVISIII